MSCCKGFEGSTKDICMLLKFYLKKKQKNLEIIESCFTNTKKGCEYK